MEETQLSKAIEADAKTEPVAPTVAVASAPSTNGNSAAPISNGNGAVSPATSQQTPTLAAVTVPIEPPGAYADQEEIDAQY